MLGSGFASIDLGLEVPTSVPTFPELSLAHETRSVQFSEKSVFTANKSQQIMMI